MLVWVKNILFGPRVNPYAGLMASSLVASRARMCAWEFELATKSIDPVTATLGQLAAAMADCSRCVATEYPETEDGTYWAMDRFDELKAALQSRFPMEAEHIIDAARRSGWHAARIVHG